MPFTMKIFQFPKSHRSLNTYLLGSLLIILSPYQLLAQFENSIDKFKLVQSIPNVAATSLLQDKEGFIWVGTTDGLIQFDGYETKLYKHDPWDSTSLSNNYANCLLEDSKGFIWVGTGHGLNRFHKGLGTFDQFFKNGKVSPQLSGNNITCLFEDSKKTIWIGTYGKGLSTWRYGGNNILGQAINPYYLNHEHPVVVPLIIFEDKKGTIWIGASKDAIYKVLPNTTRSKFPSLQRFEHPKTHIPGANDNIFTSIQEDSSNILWLGTENELYAFDKENKNFSRIGNPIISGSINVIKDLAKDPEGFFWIGTTRGLQTFHPKYKKFHLFDHSSHHPTISSKLYVNDLLIDRKGSLWVATYSGLFMVYREKKLFTRLSDESFTTVLKEDSSTIWIGSKSKGLSLYNTTTEHITKFQYVSKHSPGISSNRIRTLMKDKWGNLWIGMPNGLDVLAKDRITYYRFSKNSLTQPSLSSYKINCLLEDKRGWKWIGTTKGLNLYNGNTNVAFLTDQTDSSSIPGDYIKVIHESNQGDIWVGTNNGLSRVILNPDSLQASKFYNYLHNPEDFHTLSNNEINSIFIDSEGLIWLGTYHGLNCLDPNSNLVKHYDSKDGLPSDIVYGITQGKNQKLWIVFEKSISSFDPRTKELKTYNQAHGVSTSLVEGKFARTNDGFLMYPSLNGILIFHPDSFPSNVHDDQLVLTDLFFPDIETHSPNLASQVNAFRVLTLNTSPKVLSLQFSLLNYIRPEDNQYAYMLEGKDEDWQYIGRQRKVSIRSLPPGNYTLKVKASNESSTWTKKPWEMNILILIPLWKTNKAILVYLILLGSFVWIFRNTHKKRKGHKYKETPKVQRQVLSNIIHELRSPLTLILAPLQQLQMSLKESNDYHLTKIISKNLEQVSRLINQLHDLNQVDAKRMGVHVSQGDVVEFVSKIVDHFSFEAQKKGVKLHFNANVSEYFSAFDAHKIRAICFNLISNAIKYTQESGNIWVEVFTNKNTYSHAERQTIQIKIKDSGIGIADEHIPHIFERFFKVSEQGQEESKGSGIGLALVKEFVEILDGDISVVSQKGRGTEFILTLPLDEINDERHYFVDSLDTSLTPINNKIDTETGKAWGKDHTTILLVEDNEEQAQFISQMLNRNHNVITAFDGESGLRLAKNHIPELILCDVLLPGMNGFDFCKQLKNDPTTIIYP